MNFAFLSRDSGSIGPEMESQKEYYKGKVWKTNLYHPRYPVTMAAKIYYDSDADLSLLKDKNIVFVGFGNQGAAQAQNLRDSGISNDRILIANRDDSYAADAKSKGFHVEHDFSKAAVGADGK
ncbi:hypothetical protein C0991_000206 [Blastosporella zonata]|nr:hypothetical protein C0991_000206 [Blastosporella zonata]